MRTTQKSRNRIGMIRIPRLLPNKFLLKINKPFSDKLPGALYSKPFGKRW